MADSTKSGAAWDRDELDAIVSDYFAMLADERAGRPYVKSAHARDLMEKIGRSRGSVEFKHANISAVLGELGLPFLDGYKPRRNYQGAIFDAIDRYLSRNPLWLEDDAFRARLDRTPTLEPLQYEDRGETSSPYLHAAEKEDVFFDKDAPRPGRGRPERPPGLERLVRKFDPVARDFRNRALGREGEEIVYQFERKRLEAANRADLAQQVRWVARDEGDGAGYDIHSFSPKGEDRLIEVKTTLGARTTPFFITRNELSLANEKPAQFRLYRLYEAAQKPRILCVQPPFDDKLTLEVEAWRAAVA